MGKRLFRREKNGLSYSGVAEGNPVTLEGVTGPIDPAAVFRVPLRRPPSDIALTVALHGLIVHGRDNVSAAALASACHIRPGDLPGALRRVQGVTGTGEAKYLAASMRAGKVRVELVTKRAVRPDRYVQLSVAVLASAPTTAHSRVYAMAAEAASGDHGRGKNVASAPLADLGLDGLPDADDRLREMVDWCCGLFAARHLLDARVADGKAIITAMPLAWLEGYDHRTASLPWMVEYGYWRDRYGNLQPYGTEDGNHWEGYPLSVSAERAAKVVEWATRELTAAGAPKPLPPWWRSQWLILLYDAFRGAPALVGDTPVLDLIRITDANTAFERFVLERMERLLAGGEVHHEHVHAMSAGAWGERSRARRVIAARNSDDSRLMTYWRPPLGPDDGSKDLTDVEFEADVLAPFLAYLKGEPPSEVEYQLDHVRNQWRIPTPASDKG